MAFDHLHDTRITRRGALAIGAAAGAASLVRAGGDPLAALAAPGSARFTVAPELFGAGGLTPVLRPPARFVLLGIAHPRLLHADLHVRTRRSGGPWTRWVALHGHGDHAPDDTGHERASDPVWTDRADEIQLRATRRPARPVEVIIVSMSSTARALVAGAAAHGAQFTGQPAIVPRSAWGGDRVVPRASPDYGTVDVAFVHHTESANTYGPADSAAIVLAIAKYHRDTKGWNDIGYNFLVDRFGTIFEGRAGGIALPVIGAHAQGFNRFSTGISIIGSFMGVPAPQPALDAVARLIAWKLPLHGSPVIGQVVVTSGGGSLTQFPYGTRVTLNRICGHRDGDSTDCPGDQLYAQLPALRALAASQAAPLPVNPTVSLGAPAAARYGSTARFSGQLTDANKVPLPGQTVRIEKQAPGGGWKPVATAVTDAGGGFAIPVPWTRAGLARAAALQVTSLPVEVGVIPVITATADATRLAPGGAVTVSGTVKPSGTVSVFVERRVRGRWVRVGARGAKARPGFAIRVVLAKKGSYRLTARSSRKGRVARAAPLLVRVG